MDLTGCWAALLKKGIAPLSIAISSSVGISASKSSSPRASLVAIGSGLGSFLPARFLRRTISERDSPIKKKSGTMPVGRENTEPIGTVVPIGQ